MKGSAALSPACRGAILSVGAASRKPNGAAARPIRDQAPIILAVVLARQGRYGEAKALAADACRAQDQYGVKGALVKAKLCE